MSFDPTSQPYNQPSTPWGGAYQPKPPVVPFRPLSLGDLIDGTFSAIRSNPKVMFTISTGTMAIFGLISGIITLLTPEYELVGEVDGSTFEEIIEPLQSSGALLFPGAQSLLGIVTAFASLFVTGMLVLSVTNAVIGVNVDLKETWAQLKPHFWRLVGTALLVWVILVAVGLALFLFPLLLLGLAWGTDSGAMSAVGLLFLVAIPVGIVLVVWLAVRLYFATVATVVEGVGPSTAVSRSWTLTRGAFWRTLGRLLLMQIVVGIAASLITGAFYLVIAILAGFIPTKLAEFIMIIVTALISGLMMPISAAYTSLMYVDERIRKENLGPSLQAALDQSYAR